MIKIMHFIWVDKYGLYENTGRIPSKYIQNIDVWKQYHPDWKCKCKF